MHTAGKCELSGVVPMQALCFHSGPDSLSDTMSCMQSSCRGIVSFCVLRPTVDHDGYINLLSY